MEQCDGWLGYKKTGAPTCVEQQFEFRKLQNLFHLSHVTRRVCDRSLRLSFDIAHSTNYLLTTQGPLPARRAY